MTIMEENEIRDPWRCKAILSVDGGGIRGLFTLFVLEKLMELIAELEEHEDSNAASSRYSALFSMPTDHLHSVETLSEKQDGMLSASSTKSTSFSAPASHRYLPCHYFDYICGTGTGSLIAICLGRLQMNVNDCIKEYEQAGPKIYGATRSSLWSWMAGGGFKNARRYKKKDGKQKYLKTRIDQLAQEKGCNGFVSESPLCHTIAFSYRLQGFNSAQELHMFRSYSALRDDGGDSDPAGHMGSIWQRSSRELAISDVALACSAPSSYFEPMEIDGQKFCDAGLSFNNPSLAVFREIRDQGVEIDLFLSIGSGHGTTHLSGKAGSAAAKILAKSSSSVDARLRSQARHQGFDYHRLSTEGLPDIKLDACKQKSNSVLRQLHQATREYLGRSDVARECRKLAKRLVQRRIERSKTLRWEPVVHGTRYNCPFRPHCNLDPSVQFEHRQALMDHLRKDHKQPPPDFKHYKEIEELLNKGRTVSTGTSTTTASQRTTPSTTSVFEVVLSGLSYASSQ